MLTLALALTRTRGRGGYIIGAGAALAHLAPTSLVWSPRAAKIGGRSFALPYSPAADLQHI